MLIDCTTSSTLSRIAVTVSAISFAARPLSSASLRTSSATTAKPLPCSPARAASIAAFSASRFVCRAIRDTASTKSPIRSDASASVPTVIDVSRTRSPIVTSVFDARPMASRLEPAACTSSRAFVSISPARSRSRSLAPRAARVSLAPAVVWRRCSCSCELSALADEEKSVPDRLIPCVASATRSA